MPTPSDFETAVTYYRQSKYSRCIKACAKVLEAEPRFVDAYLLAAQAALANGNKPQAEKFLLDAVKVRPDSVVVHRNLGILFSQMLRPKEADRAFANALSIAPKDAETLYCFAVHLDTNRRPKEARVQYQKALEVVPNNPAVWTGLANAQRGMGDLEDARKSCLSALKVNPDHLPAINSYGAISVAMEDFDGAIEFLRRSIALNPRQSQVWYNLGVAYHRAERFGEAIDALNRAVEVDPKSVETLKTLGHTYQKNRDFAEAIETFGRACKIEPDNSQLSFFLACAHIEAGDVDEARAVCHRFLERRPSDTNTLACLAHIASEHGPEEEDELYNRFDRVIQTVKVDAPEGYADDEAFITALADQILDHPTLHNTGEVNATRNGLHTGNLRFDTGALAELRAAIAASIDDYVAFLRQTETNEFLAAYQPDDWVIDIWGVAMNNQGHQIAHYHPSAWISGCYYAKLPPVVSDDDPGQEGWIEFGAPPDDFVSNGDFTARAYKPILGSMFLFPGYLTHRTIPFNSDEVRISIAFDIIPA